MRAPLAALAVLLVVAGCSKAPAPTTTPAPAAGGGRGGPAVDTARYVRATPPTDPVIQRIWDEGMHHSGAAQLAQVLFDSIGPRLTNSDRYNAGQDWLIKQYAEWGVTAKKEQWGTWNSWARGETHLDLVAPRTRSLEATMLAWSPGTGGAWVEGNVILYPTDTSPEGMKRWLAQARGKFVLTSPENPSCRSPQQYAEFAQPGDAAHIDSLRAQWARGYGLRAPQSPDTSLAARRNWNYAWPKQAGVAAVISSRWSNYPGVDKIFGNWQEEVPTVDVTCEDYNLLYRLAENGQGPRVRLFAASQSLGEKPVFNVIATIPGTEKPDEYIVLSAHYDSWDGAEGATDNGTGTITMMEAVRILKTVYPHPRRTIIVGHWGGEEQGLLGSRAFVADHPDLVSRVHFGWNQDNGTGRIESISPGPNLHVTDRLVRYLEAMPSQATGWIKIGAVGPPGTGGSDHSSFQCAKAPVIGLGALNWDYGNLTWHTNRDTYDKVVLADLINNATLVAMLTYEADQDPVFVQHDVLQSRTDPQTKVTIPVTYSCPASARSSAPGR